MKKLLKYLMELLIIVGKILIFSIAFQILISILTTMTKGPVEWYKNTITLGSGAFIFYLIYVFSAVVLFYIMGRFALRFKAKRLSNAIFAVIIFLLGVCGTGAFGRNEFYSIVSPYFNFHDWFNFEITIAILSIDGSRNYMEICDWFVISLSLYLGMSSEIVTEGVGIAKYNASHAMRSPDDELQLKKFTEAEKDRIYENIRSVRGGKR